MDMLGPETMAELDPGPQQPQRPAPSPRQQSLLLPLTRAFLAISGTGCASSAVLILLTAPGGARPAAPMLALAFAVLAVAAVAALRLPPRWMGLALTAQLCAVPMAVVADALVLGWGLEAPGLSITGLMVCVLCAAAGWRAGALLALVSFAAVLTVALMAPLGALHDTHLAPVLLLGIHLVGIAAGLAAGVMISRVLASHVHAADEREERFRRLLALAADAYWEIDHQYRLVAAADQNGDLRVLRPGQSVGPMPWELPQFGCDPDTLDALQADLDTRLPFRDLSVRWTANDGRVLALLLSGEPRFDARGVFTGYWGVARDMTAMQAAHDALAATETRYQELFSRIPTPLVLHRGGRVLDANPTAVALFGHADLADMARSDLLAAYESGDSRERARRRMEALQRQPTGTALPVSDFRLVVNRRVISVRATNVLIDADGGPAMLAIYVDDTERLAAEDAVRRSEAMLSHLVATSPDLITLTDLANGRYAMVNHSFERSLGWTAAEAVGRTSMELGVWASQDDRDRFTAMVDERGAVTDQPTRFVAKDGSAVSLLVSAARFEMDRRQYMVINARDVTAKERERLEREAILANASVGICFMRGGTIVMANRHFEQMFGGEPGSFIGAPASVLWDNVAEQTAAVADTGPALYRGEMVEFERRGRRTDGSTFLGRARGRAIDLAQPVDGGTVWIIEDVTERRQFEQALARARDDAQAASRAKSAFLANTSHELRTPLNGIIGLARMAGDHAIDEPHRRNYLAQIGDSAQALAGIISDILDLSKIEAGKLLIEHLAFDLTAELHAVEQGHAPMAAARGLALHFDVAADVGPAVTGDPLRTRQIVGNFISNALKFTAAGSVQVSARRLAGAQQHVVRLQVQDSGPGIDDATRARLFKPFTQADESTTRRFGGSGLGLSICRELATLMGGAVGVDSKPGQGSCFWAELPLPVSALPLPPPLPPGKADLAGARVLMVEDNPVNMMIAVAMLERWGVHVAQAGDGRAALAAVGQAAAAGTPFDAVLMDVQMPVMSGHEATRALRATDAGRTLPIIALTAAALVTEREEALRAGMNDFLTKPIDADKLRATLARCRSRP